MIRINKTNCKRHSARGKESKCTRVCNNKNFGLVCFIHVNACEYGKKGGLEDDCKCGCKCSWRFVGLNVDVYLYNRSTFISLWNIYAFTVYRYAHLNIYLNVGDCNVWVRMWFGSMVKVYLLKCLYVEWVHIYWYMYLNERLSQIRKNKST